jgi:alpha/beta superfamily hydrolase
MVRVDRLPPPPAAPTRSPAVTIEGETETRVAGLTGGPSLEARVHVPPGAVRAVVLCHPHPLYGGSMHSPVPLAIAKQLSQLPKSSRGRVAWARFNFRGVGTSEGSYDGGRGEVADARAMIEEVHHIAPGVLVSVCGHSFGSWVGLCAAPSVAAVDRVLLIAPSSRFFAFGADPPGFGGKKTIFIGSQDEYCDLDEARALARELGADLRIFDGFDHHFLKSRRALAEAALPVIAPEASNP